MRRSVAPRFEFHPLTKERWADFARLFGARGACGGCWCMYWRLSHAEFERKKGAANRAAMRRLLASDEIPGILAYHQGRAVGWCSVAPRDRFARLGRSRILRRLDAIPVWSIVCFFVDKEYRGRGLTVQLLRAAIGYVRERGGKVLEGYPTAPGSRLPDVFAYTGLATAFSKAGFVESARRSPTRPVMRYSID